MENKKLTGIERELVLQYLMDGNVPVTITPIVENSNKETIHSPDSKIFPVAIKPEKIKVEKTGKIFINNVSDEKFNKAEDARIEFYFNRVGLYFISKLSFENNKLVINLPDEIDRIKDVEEQIDYEISAILYFEFENKKGLNQKCIPWNEKDLFERPMWKSIPLENQKIAKEYLETFVQDGKSNRNIGNGLQLIPVCNYLTNLSENKIESIQNRKKELSILYIDHERIVLGDSSLVDDYKEGTEFGMKLSFSIKDSPILSRDIFVSFYINKIYKNKETNKICIDCVYTNIQEEDVRYLYEKATKRLFI